MLNLQLAVIHNDIHNRHFCKDNPFDTSSFVKHFLENKNLSLFFFRALSTRVVAGIEYL